MTTGATATNGDRSADPSGPQTAQFDLDVLKMAEHEQVDDLVAALNRRSVAVHLLTTPSTSGSGASTLVVLLDSALESTVDEDAVRELMRNYRDAIPVTVASTSASPYLAELSHIILAESTIDEAADTIASIVMVGGQRIVEWNRLVDRARAWTDVHDADLLLDEDDSSSATILLADPPMYADEQSLTTTRAFVDASSLAVVRRRRRAITILSAIALFLVVLLVLAITGTFSANRSRSQAEDERRTAQADGLADLSTRLIDADPDLPSILIRQAAEVKVTDRVLEAANSIETSTWPHRSIELDASPLMLSGASNANRVAVLTSAPQQLRIYDTHTGSVVARLVPNWPANVARTVAISPDGTEVAAKAVGADIEILSADGRRATVPNSASFGDVLGWLDPATVAVSGPTALVGVPSEGGPPQVRVSVAPGETVRGFDRTADGKATAAITREAVYLARGGDQPVRVGIDGAMDVAISPSGETLAVAAYPVSKILSFAAGQTPSATSPQVNATRVKSTDADTFVFGTRDGDLVQTHSGDASTIKVVHAQPGTSLRLARTGSGGLATTGVDGRLRLWAPQLSGLGQETPVLFGRPYDMRKAVFAHAEKAPSFRESTRHLITVARHASRATVIAQPNYVWTVDVSTGKPTSRDRPRYFGGVNADSALSPGGTAIGVVGSEQSSTGLIGPDGRISKGSTFEGKPPPMAIAGQGEGLLAVSDDARTLMMADATHLSCWSTIAGTAQQTGERFDIGRAVAALAAITASTTRRCVSLTVDGYLRTQDGHETRLNAGDLITKIDADETRIVAAAFLADNNSAMAVTDTGDVYAITGLDARPIASVGAGLRPFALRVSPSGKHLAVIGESATTFVDASTGKPVQRIVARGDSFLSDIGFIDENKGQIIAITSMGATQLITLNAQCGTALCGITSPRQLTDNERGAYDLSATLGGR